MITSENIGTIFDTRQVGNGEFGPVFMDTLKVCITLDDGRRYVHRTSFPCGKVTVSEDGFTEVLDQSEEAEEQAQRLISKIVVAGRINLQHWEEIDPVYASDEYLLRGIEYERWLEEQAGV